MREVGKAFYLFANDYNGRFPNKADNKTWHEILNKTVFGASRIVRFPFNGIRSKWELYCPSTQVWPSMPDEWRREWVANLNVCGGYYLGSCPPCGENGYAPPKSEWPEEYLSCSAYYLGSQATLFKRPSRTFMVWECDWGGDVTRLHSTVKPDFTLNDGTFPNWSANNGEYSFRHRSHLAANFLFVDGHAESLVRTDKSICLSERYDP